jgi:tetratricopeptide (TPR) repeat protein
MTQMKVFVSHSHSNNAFCAALVHGLKAAGADVWYDEEQLHAGQLGPVIERELRERPVFLVVLSPAALRSRWVEDETRWAYQLLKREPSRILLPVLAEALPSEDAIWLFLQDFKRVEAVGLQPFSPAEAVARMLRALQLNRPGEAPQPVAPQPAESADDLLTRGKALKAQKRYAEAVPLFQRATQLAPRSFDAWFNVGYMLNLLKRYAEALPVHEQATALDPDSAEAWNNKGAALSELKRYAEALAACDRALAIDPNYALAWNNKGVALRNLDRADEALAAYDCALAVDPDNALAWYNKGNALNDLKRYAEALAAYERGFDPNDARDWRNKARVLRALGRTAEAEEAERRAMALDG